MTWPTQDLPDTDNHLRSATDSPARARTVILAILRTVRQIIGARGSTDGIASLDSHGRVPAAELGRGVAGGVAGLGSSGTVPAAQLPLGTGGGVAPLGSDFKLPTAHLPTTAPGGVATLAADGRIPVAQLAIPRTHLRVSVPPTADMDESAGYSVGSIWHHNNGQVWICVSAATAAAQWIPLNYARTCTTLWRELNFSGNATITLSESLRNFEFIGADGFINSNLMPTVAFRGGVPIWALQNSVRFPPSLRMTYVNDTQIRVYTTNRHLAGLLREVYGYGRYN